MNFFEELSSFDSEVASACEKELNRQRGNIELIASENIVSKAVLLAAGGILTNKYAEGYPAKRYYGGCQYVDIVEDLARERAKTLFGAEHANGCRPQVDHGIHDGRTWRAAVCAVVVRKLCRNAA